MSTPYATADETLAVMRQATPNEIWLREQLDRIDPHRHEMGSAGDTPALVKLVFELKDASAQPLNAVPTKPPPQVSPVALQAEPVNKVLLDALEEAKCGLLWYQDQHPESVDGSDAEAMERLETSIASAKSQMAWPRADQIKLARFDPATKLCTMNCGPHRDDPRTAAERKFLCGDCQQAGGASAQPLNAGPTKPLTPVALQAVNHLLRMMQRDGRLAYLIGQGSQSYELLTQAAAEAVGRDVDVFRVEFGETLKYESWNSPTTRMNGEAEVLCDLLNDCLSVIKTIEPDDETERRHLDALKRKAEAAIEYRVVQR